MSTLRSGLCRPGIILYLAFIVLSARSSESAPVYESDSTQVAEYDAGSSGCYYNFQRYQEGARIITNEPCLNCTCHNRMLMCYLRVCPFTKAIGQDCTVEKRPDQCCPVITCPEVPVQLLTSTTASPSKSPTPSSPDALLSFELGFPDTYGCNVNDRFFADGAQLPIEANNPCELCYCIRNKTTCLMQQCTLSVAGCRPVYQPGICCPVKYNCEYDEGYEIAAGTTPGLIMTTTLAPRTTPPQCHYDDKAYEDGELIYTIQPCQHCYCFHGEIVCAVQECGKPMESHGKNCTALPPLDGECCPTTYQCEDGFANLTTEISDDGDTKNIPEQSTDHEEHRQQESFPGADNTIPEQIVANRLPTTDKALIVTPLGNEVPELGIQEPAKLSSNKATIEEERYTTLKYENSQLAKESEGQPETTVIKTDDNHAMTALDVNDDSLKMSTGSINEISQTDIPATTHGGVTFEFPSRITEVSTAESEKEEKPITESSISTGLPAESKISQANGEITTVINLEKGIDALIDSELTDTYTTEQQTEELHKSSTKSSIIDDELVKSSQSEINTTERDLSEDATTSITNEAIEKSSESSSPISEITTTEQSSSNKIADSLLYTSDKESDKPVDSTDGQYYTTERDNNIVEYSTVKIEDKLGEEHMTSVNYEIPITSSEEYKKVEKVSTPSVFEDPLINSDDEESGKINAPIDAESATELSVDHTERTEDIYVTKIIETSTVIHSNEHIDKEKNISSDSFETSTIDTSIYNHEKEQPNGFTSIEFATASSTDEIKGIENVETVIKTDTPALANVDETNDNTAINSSAEFDKSTDNDYDKQTDKTSFPLSTEIPFTDSFHNNNNNEEVRNEAINPVYTTTEESTFAPINSSLTDNTFEKTNNEEISAEFSTAVQDHEKLPLEGNTEAIEIPEQESTEILIPERGPEHKAEDNDAVTDTEATEGSFVNESELSDSLNNTQTDRPEYVSTTYLPPHDLSTDTSQQPSTSLHEAYPKEDSEIESYITEISIPSKVSSESTTMLSIDGISEYNQPDDNIEPIEPNLHMIENERTSNTVESTSEAIPIDEISTKQTSTTNSSVEEYIIHADDVSTEQALTDKEIIEKLTVKPSLEASNTQSPILIDHQKDTSEVHEKLDDKSQVNTMDNENIRSTEMTIDSTFKDEHTETLPINLQNINEHKPELEEDISPLSKENELITEVSDIQVSTESSPNENSIPELIMNPIDKEESTKIDTLGANNKSSEPMSEDHIIDELNTVTQSSLSDVSLDTSDFNITKEVLEESLGNTETSTVSIVEALGLDEITDNDSAVTQKFTDKENELPSSSEASINTEDDQFSTTKIDPEISVNNEEDRKDITITEDDTPTETIEEHKFNNINSQLPEEEPMTSVQEESVTENLEKESLTTIIYNTEQFTERPESPDDIPKDEHKLGHSTEVNPMTSQMPEIEIKLPVSADMRPASGIPGEGNCLVDGQSYYNNSAIPPANACQLSCRCVSSIVQCDLIKCSPPPTDLPNCVPMYTNADSCCPMYTCDSTSSVELEADNQMTDNHLSTYDDKMQTKAPKNPSVDEHLVYSEITTSTENIRPIEQSTEYSIKLQPEILESTSIGNELDKSTAPPFVEKQTISSSIFIETTSIAIDESSAPAADISEETSPGYVGDRNKDTEKDRLGISNKANNTEEDAFFMTTEFSSAKLEDSNKENDINLPPKLDLEHESQTEINKLEEPINYDVLHKPIAENVDSIVTEMTIDNTPEIVHLTTQSSLFTESESKHKDLIETTAKNDITANDIQEPTYETTALSIESIDKGTSKAPADSDELFTPPAAETKPTSLDTLENITLAPVIPTAEDQHVDKLNDSDLEYYSPASTESNTVEINKIAVDSSTELSITEKQFAQSTPISSTESVTKYEEIELENLPTVSPNNQTISLSVNSESTGLNKDIDTLNGHATEIASNDLSSTISPTAFDENSTENKLIAQVEEKQVPTTVVNNSSEEALFVKLDTNSTINESIEDVLTEENVPITEDPKLILPNVETTKLTTENEESSPESSTIIQLNIENLENNEFTDTTQFEETENKFPLDKDKIESEEEIRVESTTEILEEQKEEPTTSHKELNEELGISGQEIITESAIINDNETEFIIRPTESLIEPEKHITTLDDEKTIQTESEIKTTEKSEPFEHSEIEKELAEGMTTVQSVLYHEPSTPGYNDPINTDEEDMHSPVETTTDKLLFINKTIDQSNLEVTTKIKDDEEIFSHETSTIKSTYIESYQDNDSLEILTETPNKELGDGSTSDEIPDDEQKGNFSQVTISEVATTDSTPSQSNNENEHSSIGSIVPEGPTSTIGIPTSEIQTTLSNDLREQSTKITVPEEELTNVQQTSEVTNAEDNQYHDHIVGGQQTEEPIVLATHGNSEERPIESYSTTSEPDINKPHKRPEFPDQQSTETDDENVFPPDSADIKNPFNTDDPESEDYDDQAVYGPGTCRYGGKIYMSAQQIPRDDACDFCFCFRSDIICLQQSCPPPILGCREEPIGGFCCPRYECPVSMATSLNLTTTTTTTTTTLPPHFLSHAYKGSAFRGGCQVGNKAYRVGEDIKSKSGPCMSCICGGDGKMKCEPKACSASPMLKEMIAHAAAKKRR